MLRFEWLLLGSAVAPGGFVSGIRTIVQPCQNYVRRLFWPQEAVLADESLDEWWCGRLFPLVLVFLEGFKFREQRKTGVMCIFARI